MAKLCGGMFIVCACFLILHSVAIAQRVSSEQSNANLPWDKIVWISLPIGDRVVEKAVLAVNITLHGLLRPAWMQLDLGTPQTVIYGVPYEALGGQTKASQTEQISLSGTVAGFRFENESFAFDPKYFVENKLAVIGSVRGLPNSVQKQVSFVPLQYRNGKVFVNVRLGEREEGDFFTTRVPVRCRWSQHVSDG